MESIGYKIKEYKMSVTGVFPRPVLRQAQEGTLIGRAIEDIQCGQRLVLLNSKSEFNQPGQVKAKYGKLLV